MSAGVANELEASPIDPVKVGSATVSIYFAPTTIKVPAKKVEGTEPAADAAAFTLKTYPSYIISYYEGSVRMLRRRNTLEKARKYAKEVATRLNRDGARAEFLTDRDRRIYTLAQAAAKATGLEVDEVCRRQLELQRRLKSGTPEEAVDFMNDHGQRVQLGVTTGAVYIEYLAHIEKRGAGDYHLRDIKRYVGGFVETQPGVLSQIQTAAIDSFLGALGGKDRNKNNHRDAIIAYFSFAQDKGFLPTGLAHAATATTEYRAARQKITTEAQAIDLMQPNDIYSPAEMRLILAAADDDGPLRATLEIKAFSGVRTEEIVRLWWVMMAEKEKCIRVPDAVGKIDARRVPLLPNLEKRIAAHSSELKRDRVAADWKSANSLYHAWQRVCKKAGVPYRRNAFRNSYFTYRLVILGAGEIKTVAEEGGTSPKMLKKDYLSRAPISLATAEEWFAL